MGDGATRELIFRSIYYMLNNIVNLVKTYGHYLLLWFETILNNECISY
jgi:hypothetical protein